MVIQLWNWHTPPPIRRPKKNINYVKNKVEENGINVDQLFFHDPDGCMIEICNCDNIPVVPLSEDNNVWSGSRSNCNIQNQQQQIQQMISMYKRAS
ncbi:unnamed protein product [Lupinus luteus]|uniref:Uncharacterized protein n=1 Tax=Lupinus luteus TaxID=3873 RepID=A0AAV1YI93_LUPLU